MHLVLFHEWVKWCTSLVDRSNSDNWDGWDSVAKCQPGHGFNFWWDVRAREVCYPRDWVLKWSYRFHIWKAPQYCRDGWHISELLKNCKHPSCAFEALWDNTLWHLLQYWLIPLSNVHKFTPCLRVPYSSSVFTFLYIVYEIRNAFRVSNIMCVQIGSEGVQERADLIR